MSNVDPELPQISALALANALLRNRRQMVRTGLVLAILVGAYGVLKPRSYTSRATVLAQSPRTQSSVSNLAAQFGLSLPRNDAGQSPEFYADLLMSRETLGQLAMARFPTGTRPDSTAPLWRLIGVEPSDSLTESDDAIRELARMVSATVSQKTGVVALSVRAPSPALAQAVAAKCIELVNAFNRERRQSQASAERKFTEQRFAQTNDELRAAEDRLQEFLRVNRGNVQASPNLSFQYGRLERELTVRQQVYNSLAQAFEQAKIEEVRDTPAITTIDSPSRPLRPDPRGLLNRTVLALIGGAVLALVWSWFRSLLLPRTAADEDEAEEYLRLRAMFTSELRRPWTLLGRGRSRSDQNAVAGA